MKVSDSGNRGGNRASAIESTEIDQRARRDCLRCPLLQLLTHSWNRMVVFPALSSPTRQTLNSLNVKRRRHSDDMSRPIAAGRCGAAGEWRRRRGAAGEATSWRVVQRRAVGEGRVGWGLEWTERCGCAGGRRAR